MAVDVAKIICSLAVVLLDGSAWRLWRSWRIKEFLQGSMVPAFVYTVQNVLINIAYRHLHPVTFAMLSQTKLLFTALFNFIFLRQKQSVRQVLALLAMLVAAVLLSIADHWISQVKGRSSYLMTIEMSSFSFCLLLASLLLFPSSHDAVRMRQLGFFHAWTLLSTVPILTNALAGILVGVVVQVSGGLKKYTLSPSCLRHAPVFSPLSSSLPPSFPPRAPQSTAIRPSSHPPRLSLLPSPIRQGFVMIIALLVTAAAQLLLEGEPPPLLVWLAFPLVVASTHMHAAYPYVEKKDLDRRKAE
ncbi:unnamed protein product [Closterium sp. NIES-65]|nr:unnamed protein product [Closterium sp. NIES-65]